MTLDKGEFTKALEAGLRSKEQGLPSFNLNVLLECIKKLSIAKNENFQGINFNDASNIAEYIRRAIYVIEKANDATIQFPPTIAANMNLILATNPATNSTKRYEAKDKKQISFVDALIEPKVSIAFGVKGSLGVDPSITTKTPAVDIKVGASRDFELGKMREKLEQILAGLLNPEVASTAKAGPKAQDRPLPPTPPAAPVTFTADPAKPPVGGVKARIAAIEEAKQKEPVHQKPGRKQ